MSSAVGFLRLVRADRRVLGAVSSVAAAGVVVKLVATLKEFVVAGIYGRSDAYEAFLAAALIPALLMNIVSESMSQALVPTFVRVREEEGPGHAQRLLSNVFVATLCLLAVLSLLTACLANRLFPLIGSHFSPAKLMLAEHVFYALLPVVFLTAVASNCTAVANTTGRFGGPAAAAIAGPGAVLILAPLLASRYGIWAMVYGTIAGAGIQAVAAAGMMRRGGYQFSLEWRGMDTSTLEVMREYGPVLLSGVVASGGLLVDQAMAAMLPAGSLAALAYGGRFTSVAMALLGGSISSAVTPVFSEMVARGDWRGCRRSLGAWAWMSGGVAALVSTILIVGAKVLVKLTLEHGVFGVQDSAVVTEVLEMYAIQIPFFVCSRVFYRFLIAMRRTELVFYCGLINLVLDVVLNLLLMRRMGVAGIALATSVWTMSTLAFLGYWSWRVLREKEASTPVRVG